VALAYDLSVSLTAITRAVPERISQCVLTHIERVPIDYARAVAQHEEYEAALRTAGCTVERLPARPDLPDSVFVEDAAVVLDEVAIVTRPGVPSRQAETASVAGVLAAYRPLRFIEAPGTLDGGDVLRAGRRVFVGRSSRTNADGIAQLRALLLPFDYTAEAVETTGCLHLKSAVTSLADDWLLINAGWIDTAPFAGYELTAVDPAEPFAANVLRIGETILCAAAWTRTRARLDAAGLKCIAVDVSELAKAEAGVTCCSLIVS
jgi:dimethylargininase